MLIDAEHHNSCCAHVFASQSSITIHVAHMTIHLAHMSLQVRATPPIPHLFLHQDHNESTVCLLLREGSVCQEVSVRKCLSQVSVTPCLQATHSDVFVCVLVSLRCTWSCVSLSDCLSHTRDAWYTSWSALYLLILCGGALCLDTPLSTCWCLCRVGPCVLTTRERTRMGAQVANVRGIGRKTILHLSSFLTRIASVVLPHTHCIYAAVLPKALHLSCHSCGCLLEQENAYGVLHDHGVLHDDGVLHHAVLHAAVLLHGLLFLLSAPACN